ncbi:MAG: hypothetical protein Q4P66_00225 [Actinomycetaceae bacterium]|nr:hypothetical protein [Actinomycetaceae bacterium]
MATQRTGTHRARAMGARTKDELLQTVNDLYRKWIDAKSRTWSILTRCSNESKIRHCLQQLGHIEFNALTREQIETCFNIASDDLLSGWLDVYVGSSKEALDSFQEDCQAKIDEEMHWELYSCWLKRAKQIQTELAQIYTMPNHTASAILTVGVQSRGKYKGEPNITVSVPEVSLESLISAQYRNNTPEFFDAVVNKGVSTGYVKVFFKDDPEKPFYARIVLDSA